MMRRTPSWILDGILALAALLAIGWSLAQLHNAAVGVDISRTIVGGTPVTVYRSGGHDRARPVILIAHGFAGSQQLMQPFATTFARGGYTAVTFDFMGHGRNPQPLIGSITDARGATRTLVDQTARIGAFARTLGDGRLAVLGHSMATDIAVRFAEAEPNVSATIAVSMFSPAVTPTMPKNLLVIVGGLETTLKREALRAVGKATAPAPAAFGVTYGDFTRGTARRAQVSNGVEHVSVLYSPASMAAALAWADRAFGTTRSRPPYLDHRGPWILILLAGIIALGRPLSRLLPLVSMPPVGAGLGWRAIWPCVLIPPIATPLILRMLPTHFLPILVGDYLSLHFGFYGLITLLCLRRRGGRFWLGGAHTSSPKLAAAALAVTAYAAMTLGWAIDSYVTSFIAVPARVPLILAMLVGTTCFFLSDEWLTRGVGAARGAFVLTKLAFLVSLAMAVALDFERLFFLVIIVPVILIVLIVFGVLSAWSYRRTGNPFPAAIAEAIAFAWAIGVTFPMIAA